MKRYKQLYESVCSFENLYAAAVKALKGKRGKRPGAGFYAEMEDEIVTLQRQLLDGTYCHGGYHYFEIHEPKQRTVAAEEFRDRVVHHAVVRCATSGSRIGAGGRWGMMIWSIIRRSASRWVRRLG